MLLKAFEKPRRISTSSKPAGGATRPHERHRLGRLAEPAQRSMPRLSIDRGARSGPVDRFRWSEGRKDRKSDLATDNDRQKAAANRRCQHWSQRENGRDRRAKDQRASRPHRGRAGHVALGTRWAAIRGCHRMSQTELRVRCRHRHLHRHRNSRNELAQQADAEGNNKRQDAKAKLLIAAHLPQISSSAARFKLRLSSPATIFEGDRLYSFSRTRERR